MYRHGGTALFVGLERVVGSLGGRSRSFVVPHKRTFQGDTAGVDGFFVSGPGTVRVGEGR